MSGSYYRNVNPELLGWLPINVQRVLEFGCGEAALAAAYKMRNPSVHYTGAEIHGPSAQVARTRVDRLVEGDIEALPDSEIAADGLFDVAVMGDVLEHLSDPWRILSRLHGLLHDGGHLALCVPNIAHWSGLAELLGGHWPARDSGLFDRTHLRFFTLDSLTRILGEVGFQVVKARPRNVPLDRAAAERAIPILADAAQRLGHDRAAFIARANALQYVVVARKAVANPPPRVLRLHVAALAPRFLEVRARLPAEALSSLPDLVVTRGERGMQLPVYPVETPKICVLQRLAVTNASDYLGWVRSRIRDGWLLVAESDDHPELFATVYKREVVSEDWLPVTSVHAAQTSTPALADTFRSHIGEVACFPNAVFTLPPFEPKPGPLRVFLGALNRERVTAKVAQALAGFCAAHPEVEFVVMHDRAFFDGLAARRKTFHTAGEYDAYLDLMAGCHIALMPLEGTFGETFKSDVKFLEAASRGVVAIASPVVYADTIVEGETGLIAQGLDDWGRLLTELAEDEASRLRIARNAWDYVRRERMFAAQAATRQQWYNDLWDRRDALTAALLTRHPELAASTA